jgi:hypothetical protein
MAWTALRSKLWINTNILPPKLQIKFIRIFLYRWRASYYSQHPSVFKKTLKHRMCLFQRTYLLWEHCDLLGLNCLFSRHATHAAETCPHGSRAVTRVTSNSSSSSSAITFDHSDTIGASGNHGRRLFKYDISSQGHRYSSHTFRIWIWRCFSQSTV